MDRTDEMMSKLAMLQAQIDELASKIAEMDDDIPEDGGAVFQDGGESGWSGRVLSHDGTVISEWDVSDPDNITDEYILYDGVAASAKFDSAPDGVSLCWHVADAPVAPSTDYTLSADTCGDIVLPVPKEWDERQVVQSDPDGKLKFDDVSIKADDPATGFEFVKEEGGDELLQMKPVGGSEDDVLVRTGEGAGWAKVPVNFTTQVEQGEGFDLVLFPATESTEAILRLEYPEFDGYEDMVRFTDLNYGPYIKAVIPTLAVADGKLTLTLAFIAEEIVDGITQSVTMEDAVAEIDIEECP